MISVNAWWSWPGWTILPGQAAEARAYLREALQLSPETDASVFVP